jgi:polyketide cyclase/dehydrase/lipid transport protein
MPSVTKTVELDLSQDDAFALATDPNRFGEWLTLHTSWPNGAPESTETGSEFVQQLTIMGMPAQVNWKVQEYDAPSKFAISGEGPMGAVLVTTISATATDGGATVSYEAEFSGNSIQGPIGDMVTKTAGDELDKSLAKLRELAG